MEDARIRRSQRKSVLARHINTLQRLLVEEKVQDVKSRLQSMSSTFEELETAHYAYHDGLSSEDAKTINKSAEWFAGVTKDYLEEVSKAKQWLKDSGVETKIDIDVKPSVPTKSSEASEVSQLSKEIAASLRMPQVDVPTFCGDPKAYTAFITAFDEMIGTRVSEDRVKLLGLIKHISGEAHKAIVDCSLLSATTGYNKARDILKTRFGDPYVITSAVVNGLKHGKSVTRANELFQLVNDLDTAHSVLSEQGTVDKISDQEFIWKVLERCHTQVRGRWRKFALDHKISKGAYPDFHSFVSFLTKEAKMSGDHVYGYDACKPKGHKDLSCMHVSNQVTKCFNCQGNHTIYKCRSFLALTPRERFDVVKTKGLCFCCLSSRHMSRGCRSESCCQVPGCGRRHHSLLHFNQAEYRGVESSQGARADEPSNPRQPATASQVSQGGAEIVSNFCDKKRSNVLLPILPVLVNGVKTYALLDNGSTGTMITQDLARRLGLTGETVTCDVNTVGPLYTLDTSIVDCKVSSLDGKKSFDLSATVVTNIPARIPAGHIDLQQYPYLQDLPLGVAGGVKAEVIIAADYPDLTRSREVRACPRKAGQPYATRTALGWVLQGPVSGMVESEIYSHCISFESGNQELQNLWKIEQSDDDISSWSIDDRKVISLWDDRTCFKDGHYEIPVPWKEDHPHLPNNRYVAQKRLQSTVRRLERTGRMEDYQAGIEKLLEDGHAEAVPERVHDRDDGKVWYLPHHAVFSEAKPDKLRIVFDCAAQYLGISLNNQCLQGPNLVNNLLHVLLRFRQFPYAVMADVEAMYLQVRIPEDDRDCLRFLWYQEQALVEYRMTSHLFGGVWCSASSTYALRKVLKDFPSSELVNDTVQDCMYVDDMLKSVPQYQDAVDVIHDVKGTLQKGGFNLTKFVTNDRDLLESIPMDDRAKEVKLITPDTFCKALGLRWDISDDAFFYQCKHKAESVPVTRRIMLSIVSSLYDPLGLLAPIILLGRMLFQDATRLQVGWDDALPAALSVRWNSWLISLDKLPGLKFSRCLIPQQFAGAICELHHFCDGSSKAYGSCTYLRVLNANGEILVNLLLAKVRVAPMKSCTVPRLELCAAVSAARVDQMVKREMKISLLPSTFWSDSQIVLAYISNESSRFKVFVANRVSFIREVSEPSQWRYVPSATNPADVLSRGCLPAEMPEWWAKGPGFLQLHRCYWPVFGGKREVPVDDAEIKKEKVQHQVMSVTTHAEPQLLEALIGHYSSYYRLKKALCWWIRFVSYIKKEKVRCGSLTVAELKDSQRVLVSYVQKSAFPDEYKTLSEGRMVPKSSSILALRPKMQDSVIVVGGRLCHAALPASARFPMILPTKHVLSHKILHEAHCDAHLGAEWTLGRVRREFWIPKARNELRRIKKACVVCRRLYSRPCEQVMADLPAERCAPGSVAFQHIGVDLFGPFFVQQRRASVKRYGCVFTCFTTRAVHLEVLNSLETDAFINGFVRFCARRGYPKTVKSDNGTNLVGARRELSAALKSLDRRKVVHAARRMDIEWSFNPPLASHQGGVWERMIRTIRRVIMAVLSPKTRLTDEILSTVFCEVENLINGRPITKGSCVDESEVPLTPNHLLLMEANPAWDWGEHASGDVYRRRWKYVQSLVNAFWAKWVREYLPELQGRSKWKTESSDIKKGELVLMVEDNTPRGLWPLAIVEEAITGRDGHVRSLRLSAKGSVFIRPITKVVSLELS